MIRGSFAVIRGCLLEGGGTRQGVVSPTEGKTYKKEDVLRREKKANTLFGGRMDGFWEQRETASSSPKSRGVLFFGKVNWEGGGGNSYWKEEGILEGKTRRPENNDSFLYSGSEQRKAREVPTSKSAYHGGKARWLLCPKEVRDRDERLSSFSRPHSIKKKDAFKLGGGKNETTDNAIKRGDGGIYMNAEKMRGGTRVLPIS